MRKYLHELWKRKDLLLYLVTSGLKAEHRNTLLGYFWWLLDPLLGVVVYYFLRVVILGAQGEHIVAFLAIGLIVFRNFGATLRTSAKSISGKSGVITQVYLPKALFPFGTVLTQLINFSFALIVIAAVLAVSGIVPGPEVLWLPVVMLVQIVFHSAVALLMAYICVFIRDLENILTHVMRLLRYGSPVIWEIERLPEAYHWVVDINPFAWVLNAYRDILMYGSLPDFQRLTWLVVGCGAITIGLVYFYSKNEHRLIKAL